MLLESNQTKNGTPGVDVEGGPPAGRQEAVLAVLSVCPKMRIRSITCSFTLDTWKKQRKDLAKL
jgi:hypothetical protein